MASDKLDERISSLYSQGVLDLSKNKANLGIIPTLQTLSKEDYPTTSRSKQKELAGLKSEIERLVGQWHSKYPPIIAVAGLKNAGKSSFVKTFLSDENRKRLPTGVESAFSTRRYVFWLPESWQHGHEAKTFEEMLRNVFGHEIEPLSLDPTESARQYREDLGYKGMKRPLVAYDRNLDEWKCGLLDCPDIESGDGQNEERLVDARDMLEKAAKLCSGFAIVGQYDSFGRDFFWRILRIIIEAGDKTEKFLVINKCPPKPALQIRKEVIEGGRKHNFAFEFLELYASYNFTSRGMENYAIRINDGCLPEGCAVGDEPFDLFDGLLPTTFSCEEEGPHPPEPISVNRLLQSRVRSLSSDLLQKQLHFQTAVRLREKIEESRMLLTEASRLNRDAAVKCYKVIAKQLLKAMSKDGKVRPLTNTILAKRQSQLLIDEAPATIRASLIASNWIQKSAADVGNAIANQYLGKTGKIIQKSINVLRQDGTKLDSEEIASELKDSPNFARLTRRIDESTVEGWIKGAFQEFSDKFDDDVEQLRPLVRKYFDELTVWQKIRAHSFAVFTLGSLTVGALLAAVDGGATLYGISLIEAMLIAAGVTAAQIFQSEKDLVKAERPLIEGQLAFLTSHVGSSAGLPSHERLAKPIKVIANGETYTLPETSVKFDSELARVKIFDVDETFYAQILDDLDQFLKQSDKP